MRPIIFRAKRTGIGINAGKWVYGSLIHSLNGVFMYGYQARCQVPVDPSTIGQFTGLHDKNRTEIYEGDLLLSEENAEVFEVVYDAPRFCFKDNVFGFRFLNHPEFFHVIGNVFDDAELINKHTND